MDFLQEKNTFNSSWFGDFLLKPSDLKHAQLRLTD